ncbi:MAG: hypothetical protein HY013_21040, partial [Candidatus Solibacter usitatus]|nr:hypothetical protein [Candidatus Solibacter usitatus]
MIRAAALWLVPVAVCLALYWPGLTVFFQQDDFAWLGLSLGIYSPRDFWRAMFAPMAQGTIRPWSERAFFMGFYRLFGLDPLPFRIWVFLTQFANLALIAAITRRITGSRAAGVWAPLLWISNSVLISVMTWSSGYNQALCAFFLLSAFYCFLRGWYGRQWIAFLLGFGALEINVVYPALATSYALLLDRPRWKKTLPLWLPSIAYTLLHRSLAPKVAGGPYLMHLDASIFTTLGKYWLWSLGPIRLENITTPPAWLAPLASALLTAGLAWWVAQSLRRQDRKPLFFLAWFLLTLAPVLPLRDHASDYYLTIPSIGLAMLVGQAAWTANRIVSSLLILVYLGFSLPVARTAARWSNIRSHRIERMLAGVARARQLHPDKLILLHGVNDELFYTGILDKPFRLIGVADVYLTPESAERITPKPELGFVTDYVLPQGPTLAGLAQGRIVVYEVGGERLKNITRLYEATSPLQLKAEEPRRVDVGNPLLAYLLGKSWHAREAAYRWMPGRATVRIGGPRTARERLYITGYYPAEQLEKGPVHVRVSVDGQPLPESTVQRGMERFDFDYVLPA